MTKTLTLTDKQIYALAELVDAIAPSYGPTVETQYLQDEVMHMSDEEVTELYGILQPASATPSTPAASPVVSTEPYWNIYNRYNALNESGMDIVRDTDSAIKILMDKFHQFNPRDVRSIIEDIAGGQSAHRVVKRGMAIRNAEKAAKKEKK